MNILNFRSSPIGSFTELIAEAKLTKADYDLELIEKAFEFANRVHDGQLRKSGELFIIHPLTVAVYVVRLGLDTISVVAALLHDTVEDSSTSIDDIDREFGTEVAYIVDGMTNVKKYAVQFSYNETIENIQHLLIKSAGDIRVLIIRLCDKLHNALTSQYLKPEKKIRFANGLRLIFAPLAEYVGLGYFKKALDDIAFSILEPDEYLEISNQLASLRGERERILNEVESDLKELFAQYKLVPLSMFGRTKGIYSTYRKLKKHVEQGKGTTFEITHLFDTTALSVICVDIQQCYLALGLIHSHWTYLPERFDDYISNPKPNGYRSLQTTVEFEDEFVEIQIKTPEMHEYNEFGPASHISYKLNGPQKVSTDLGWVKSLNDWQSNLAKSDFRLKTFADSVFAFTPKGAVKRLDQGATPLDFAFQVHTQLGVQFAGAKVNGKMVSMDTKLKTGDIVEIVVDKKQKFAKQDWLKIAQMRSSKHRIRQSLKQQILSLN